MILANSSNCGQESFTMRFGREPGGTKISCRTKIQPFPGPPKVGIKGWNAMPV